MREECSERFLQVGASALDANALKGSRNTFHFRAQQNLGQFGKEGLRVLLWKRMGEAEFSLLADGEFQLTLFRPKTADDLVSW